MAIDVTVETTIARPVDEVFAVIADLDAWPDWLVASGITAVRRQASGPVTPGERLVVEQTAAGRAGRFAAEVSAVDVPGRIAVKGRDDDGIDIEIDAALAPLDTDRGPGTVVRWTIRIGLPLRLRILEGIARPQVEGAVRLDLNALRRRLESSAPD